MFDVAIWVIFSKIISYITCISEKKFIIFVIDKEQMVFNTQNNNFNNNYGKP